MITISVLLQLDQGNIHFKLSRLLEISIGLGTVLRWWCVSMYVSICKQVMYTTGNNKVHVSVDAAYVYTIAEISRSHSLL